MVISEGWLDPSKIKSSLGFVDNGDGTYTLPSGQIKDKWGNTWNPQTGSWYNQEGQQWYGTNPGTGTGIFGPPNSFIDPSGKVQTGADDFDLASLMASAGGGGSPDHFFDINPLDQAKFDFGVGQQKWENDLETAKFNWQKAQDDRDYALALGNLDLAKKAQADANYWQGKSLEMEQARLAASERMNAADNAARISAAQIDAQSKIQASHIAAMADRYAADQRLREGLANAHNERERTKVMLAHERELANIAKMEDDTRRLIASQEQRIGAFNAETNRAAQMGDIAVKNNQFILDASKSPRDLFGLFFMQKGLTPDWNSMAQGNAPVQGDPLRVYDPMKAYQPKVTLPENFNLGPGQSYGNVGNAVNNISLENNPWLSGNAASQAQQNNTTWPQQGAQAVFLGGYATGTDLIYGDPRQEVRGYTTEPAFMVGDAPTNDPFAGGARPEIIENPTGAPIRVKNTMQTAADFGLFGDPIDSGQGFGPAPITNMLPQQPIQPVQNVQQQQPAQERPTMPRQQQGLENYNFVDYGPVDQQTNGGIYINQKTRQKMRDPAMQSRIAGRFWDPMSSMLAPEAPDIDQGLVQAAMRDIDMRMEAEKAAAAANAQPKKPGSVPVSVAADYGIKPGNGYKPGEKVPDLTGGYTLIDGKWVPSNGPSSQLGVSPSAPLEKTATNLAEIQSKIAGGVSGPGLDINNVLNNGQFTNPIGNPQQLPPNWLDVIYERYPWLASLINRNYMGTDPIKRYPTGTDPMSFNWLNLGSSANSHLQGQDMPSMIKMLADYGMPIAPGLFSSVTGQGQNQSNLGYAFNQRGGGALPSLQTLNRNTQGENELFAGYVQGPVGMPMQDVVDFIGRPTQNLRTAQRSQGMI